MRMLLALRDVKVGRFLAPVAVLTPGEAERWYSEAIRSEGTMVGKYPNDFPLYQIGTYDDESGTVTPLVDDQGNVALPRLLLEAAQLLPLRKEG